MRRKEFDGEEQTTKPTGVGPLDREESSQLELENQHSGAPSAPAEPSRPQQLTPSSQSPQGGSDNDAHAGVMNQFADASGDASSEPSENDHPPTSRQTLPVDSEEQTVEVASDVLGGDNKGEDTDATPTIISKNPPSGSGNHHFAQPLSGNLRGRRLAHFELIEAIGVGGMAAVIRARDLQLDRFVALKILPPDMASEQENVKRFQHEARAAAKLDHENIARVFYYGEDQSLNFIAFEFVEGDNLRTVIHRRGWLSVQDAIHYMLQVASGLAHAASRNVVHRDIKPSNIIITPGGGAKLVDMGLARCQQNQNSQALTQSGVTLGTFDYISPEQALEPREADVRSDIYSLGCTFYHALTGQPPVPDGTAAKKLHYHQHVAPTDPRELNPGIPDSLAAVLDKMMAKNAKDRYQRPEDLVQHLIVLAQQLSGQDVIGSEGAMLYVDTPLPSPPKTKPGLLMFLALIALFALVGFLSFVSSVPPPDSPKTHPIHQEGNASNGNEKSPEFLPFRPQNQDKASQPSKETGSAANKKKVGSEVIVGNGEDLKAWLNNSTEPKNPANVSPTANERRRRFILRHPTKIKIPSDGKPLTIENKDTTIEGEGIGNTPPTLTFEVTLKDLKSNTLGLLIRNGKLRLKNLRVAFRIDLSEFSPRDKEKVLRQQNSPLERNFRAAAIRIAGKASLKCEKCIFTQEQIVIDKSSKLPPLLQRGLQLVRRLWGLDRVGRLPITTIEVTEDAESSGTPEVSVKMSYFHKGEMALSLRTPAKVEFEDCGFGPHTTTFRVVDSIAEHKDEIGQDEGPMVQSTLRLKHCTSFISDGKIFQLGGGTGCQIATTRCVFIGRGNRDTLVEQQVGDGSVDMLQLEGDQNMYSGIDHYLVQTTEEGTELPDSIDTWKEFAEFVALPEGTSGRFKSSRQRSIELTNQSGDRLVSKTKLGLMDRDKIETNDLEDLLKVFRINLELKELSPLWRISGATTPVGMTISPLGPIYPEQELANFVELARKNDPKSNPPLPTMEPQKLVVDPLAKIHRTLHAVIPDATDGTTIYIKHDGPLEFTAPAILQDDIEITIKPYKDMKPILTLDETKITDTKEALFHIRKGRIRFEKIEFQLDPNRRNRGKTNPMENQSAEIIRSVVALSSPGSCCFDHCLFTFEAPKDKQVRLRAVRLEPVDSLATTKSSEIDIMSCVLRGSAVVVSITEPTPYKLNVKKSLIALDGSLLEAKVNPTTSGTTLEESPIGKLSLVESMTYLTQDMIILNRTKLTLQALVTEVTKAENCFFAAATSDRSLIHVNGADTETRATNLYSWNGDSNCCSGYHIDSRVDKRGMMDTNAEKSWKMYGMGEFFSTKELLPLEKVRQVRFASLTPGQFVTALLDLEKQLKKGAKGRQEDPKKMIPAFNKYCDNLRHLSGRLFAGRTERSTSAEQNSEKPESTNFFNATTKE
ncbi:MAG: serine/threonine-protein kinase [Gemmataceae bacterium]